MPIDLFVSWSFYSWSLQPLIFIKTIKTKKWKIKMVNFEHTLENIPMYIAKWNRASKKPPAGPARAATIITLTWAHGKAKCCCDWWTIWQTILGWKLIWYSSWCSFYFPIEIRRLRRLLTLRGLRRRARFARFTSPTWKSDPRRLCPQTASDGLGGRIEAAASNGLGGWIEAAALTALKWWPWSLNKWSNCRVKSRCLL